MFDHIGRVWYASPVGLAALGLQAEELLGKTWRELNFAAEVMEHYDAQREAVFQTGIATKGEISFATTQGLRSYEFVISPMMGVDGEITAVVNTSRDITERKLTEAAWRQLTEALEASIATKTEELTALNQSLRAEIVERQRAEQALKESEIRFQALIEAVFEGIVIQEHGKIIEANPGFARMFGYSLEEVMGKSAADFLTPESVEVVLRHTAIHYEFPYEVTGIRKDGTRIILEVVGKQSLYQGRSVRVSAARDITDRKQAEIALIEKEQQLQQLSDSMPQFVWINNNQGETEYVNRQWLEYSGLTMEQSRDPEKVAEFFHPDEAQSMSEQWRIAQATQQPFELEARLRRASDDTYRWFLIRSVPALDEQGQVVRWYGTSTDIHDRKRTEAELRERERLLSTLAEALPVSIFRFDVNSHCTYINNYWTAMSGRSVDSVVGLGWLETLHPEDRDRLANAWLEWSQDAQQQGLYQSEGRLVHLNGKDVWYYIQALPEVNDKGQTIGYIAVMTDITERKQTEQILKEREAILRLFAQYAPAGIAMFDREMQYVIASQRWTEDYNQGPLESVIGRSLYELFSDLPERWRQVHQRCLAGAIEKCDEDLFVQADGRQQWIRWETRPWYTATDAIGGIIIFAEDITQRKESEATVLQLNRELQQKITQLQTLLDVIPIGIGIAEDPDCQNIRVNPACANALGIPSTVNASLSAPEELPLQYAAMYGVEVRDLELEVVWQDGTTVTLLEYAAPLFDEDGQPCGSIGAFLDITERKRAEAALRESEERYRILIQNFPNGAVCLFDHDLRYILVGGQGLAEIGLDRAFLEGKTIWEAYDSETCRLIEPGYRAALAGHSHIEEIPYSGRIYHSHLLPLYDDQGSVQLAVSMTQNITLQKQAEQALRASRDELEQQVQERTRELQAANTLLAQREREFRTLVENTPDVITRHDRQHRCLYINPACIQSLGMPPEFFVGKTPSELGYPEDLAQFWETSLKTVLSKGEMQIDEFIAMNGDDPRSYQVYLVPEREADRSIVSVVTIGRDVTSLRQAEASARQLAEELQRSNQELEQFAYIASHDLQEPLRAITSFTQLLAQEYKEQLGADADMYIEFIVDGAARMQQLIRDLLTYSRVGRYELQLQPVDCNALLERVKNDLQVAIAENQAVITADPLPTITADPNQMANLLQNLISNSLKYRSEADPRIHIAARSHIVEETNDLSYPGSSHLTQGTAAWLFSLQDNGIGIESQYAKRIFGIFQRLHTSDEYSGTGLGLAICQKIIERHQGRIWVESQLGQGATFFFTIPLSP